MGYNSRITSYVTHETLQKVQNHPEDVSEFVRLAVRKELQKRETMNE